MAWYAADGVLIKAEFPPVSGVRVNMEWDAEEAVIPKYVSVIGKMAFGRCACLRRAVIPDSVEVIEERAFMGCGALTEVVIPEGVKEIGDEAFAWCDALEVLSLPRSLKSIGGGVFKGCRALREIRIAPDHECFRFENGLIFSKENTLVSALMGIKKAVLPDSVTCIAAQAFAMCGELEEIVLPQGLETIGHWAFSGCAKLKKISVPQSVSFVGHWAFEDCAALQEIALSAAVEFLGENAFYGCSSLKALSLPGQFAADLDGGLLKQLDDLRCMSRVEEVPGALRTKICVSFAEQESCYPEAAKEEHFSLIRKHAARLMEAAFEHPMLMYLMCREVLLSVKNADMFAEEAMEKGNVELTALLLDYQANKLTFEAVVQERERMERMRERQDDIIIERAAARMDKRGIRELNFAAAGRLKTFDNRAELKKFITRRGGRLLSGVSEHADYLIVSVMGMNAPGVHRAEELGIEIITETEFLKMAREGEE